MSATALTRRVSVPRAGWLAQPGSRGEWLARVAAMLRAARTRRELAMMDDRQLRDIGLTRAAAVEEALRAPWDLVVRQRGSAGMPR